MSLAEAERLVMNLSEKDRAQLAASLLNSLPAVLVDEDEGVAEAQRRSEELDSDASVGCSWDEIKKDLSR